MWAKMARAAQAKAAAGDSDPFYANKLNVGRYFLDRLLPEADAHLGKLKSGSASMMAMDADAF
jgi:hypothetical protein